MSSRDTAENLAARRLVSTLQITRAEAFRLLREKKHAAINWGQAADVVLAERAGPGLFEEGAQ